MHRDDVCKFSLNLEYHLLELRNQLLAPSYRHGGYRQFVVHDPKRRLIHVPTVRDQVLHQAVWNVLFPFFDHRFCEGVTSCRPKRGTDLARRIIRGWTRSRRKIWILHVDVKKCFDSLSHHILQNRISTWIDDAETLGLLQTIIDSYAVSPGLGIPLGNLTSQLFCNVYFMPIDRWLDGTVGNELWVRYADDIFVKGISPDALELISNDLQRRLSTIDFKSRVDIQCIHGFEALGSRWFYGGGQSLARPTRRRSLSLLLERARAFQDNALSQGSFVASAASIRGLSLGDHRWRKQVQHEILEVDYGRT
jgi:retron-type reverse transcriptase